MNSYFIILMTVGVSLALFGWKAKLVPNEAKNDMINSEDGEPPDDGIIYMASAVRYILITAGIILFALGLLLDIIF